MDIKKYEVDAKIYEQIAALIQSEASPVGIDAKKTHIIILNKLQEVCDRLERIERLLIK